MSPPIDLEPLLALGRRCEALFGHPQDIEWAYANGRFHLLQSRDITTTPARLERERARVLDVLARSDVPVDATLAQNELAEVLPRPTPVSLSLLERLWRSGGSVDRACRRLGLRYDVADDSPPYAVTVFGRLYVNVAEARRRAPRVGAFARRRLARAAREIDAEYRATFGQRFEREMRLLAATDFSQLPVADLVAELGRLAERFTTRTYVAAEMVNVVAEFHVQQARRALTGIGVSPAPYLASSAASFPVTMKAIANVFDPEKRLAAFLEHFGHRAPVDYELASPRYAEDHAGARLLMKGLLAAPGREVAPHDLPAGLGVVAIARRLQEVKEAAKHQALREVAILRKLLVALDARLGLGGLVFYLTIDEIESLGEADLDDLRFRAAQRERDARLFDTVPPLPVELRAADFETAALDHRERGIPTDGALTGTLVSGSGDVSGRAYVVAVEDAERGGPLVGFADGDIIVSRFIHANWLPYTQRAGGLVSELGGWLSHMAIVAREYSLTMVVGVRNVERLETGMALHIADDGSIVVQDEAKDPARR